ncbi:Laminin G, subdomain protein 2 domain protein [Candidatus Magnetomorum sp. HK-1]|nr:Laminin G, subdomain protein 2 domain protein [Candidatus Magnetomorum sp. HK-1]
MEKNFYLFFLSFFMVFIYISLEHDYYYHEKKMINTLSNHLKYEVPNGKPLFLGNPDKDGSWRIIHNNNDIIIQKRFAGVWSAKFSITDSISTDVLHATEDVEIGGTSVITSIVGSGITVTKNGNAISLTVTQGNGGIASILDTSDTPNSYSIGKILLSTGSGFEYTDLLQTNLSYGNGLTETGGAISIDTSGGISGQILQHTGSGVQWSDVNSNGVNQEVFNNISNNETVQVTANTITIEEKITISNNDSINIISDSNSSKWNYEDAKGSITQFIVDTTNISGHFTNGSSAITLGPGNTEYRVIESLNFKLVGDSNIYAIISITDDGDANDGVSFALNDGTIATLGVGSYSVEWIRGTNMKDEALKLVNDAGSGNDSDTVLLIHSNTTNGSTLFINSALDASTYTVAANDNVKHTTETKIFGASSISFDGTNDCLYLPDSTDWDLGAGDFVIDLWVRISDLSENLRNNFITTMNSSLNGWFIGYQALENRGFIIARDGAVFISTSDHGSYSDNTWYHVAFVRDGINIYIYVNGVKKVSSTTFNSDSMDVGHTEGCFVGKRVTDISDFFVGYLDEIRITKGTNRGWTGSTITVYSEAYGAGKFPINKFYTTITNNIGQFDTTAWTKLNSGSLTELLNNQIASYCLSFDNRSTFQIYDSATGAWRNIVRDNSGTWQYNNSASGSEIWQNATINEMAATISEAVTISENQMIAEQFNAITGGDASQWLDGWNYAPNINIAVSLKTITSTNTPEVSAITFNYNEVFTRLAALTDGIATGSFTAQADDFTIGTRTWTIRNVSGETKSFIVNKF